MTARKATTRPRRTASVDDLPAALVEWFSGTGPKPWHALLPFERELLPERFAAYRASNPDATPPAGFEWITDTTDPRYPTAAQVAEARKMVARIK